MGKRGYTSEERGKHASRFRTYTPPTLNRGAGYGILDPASGKGYSVKGSKKNIYPYISDSYWLYIWGLFMKPMEDL